jgi:iron complex outermembrane recepter protein
MKRSFALLFTTALTLAIPQLLPAQNEPADTDPATDTKKTSKDLPEVVVNGKADPSYKTDTSTTATLPSVPIKDLPASVQVVTRAVIEDRGVTQVSQMLDTVSGVHAEASYGANQGMFFNVRGFSSANSLRDGFRAEGNLASRDVQNISSVEVLKGPSGALYSAMGSLGGYINVVSKRPQAGTFGTFGITAGSYGLFRPTMDYNTQLNEDGTLLGRLNMSYEHNDTFRNFGAYSSFAVAPSVQWKPDRDTTITLLTEYDSLYQNHFDYGVFNDPQTLAGSRRTYYGLPGIDYGRNKTYAATLIFEHKLNDQWTWRESFNYTGAKQDSASTFPIALNGSPALSYLSPYNAYITPYVVPEYSRNYSLQNDLVGKFSTGSIKHSLLSGVSLSQYTRGGNPFYQAFGTMNLQQLNYSNTFDPSTLTLYDVYDDTIRDLGLYVQDLIELTNQWKLFTGLRADWNQTKLTSHIAGDGGMTNHFFNLSPRAGVVYQPAKDTSLYFSWGRSAVTVAQTITGTPGTPPASSGFQPEVAEQLEAGVKQDFLNGKLSSTLAVYQITRSKVLTQDPSNPMQQIQVGQQQSRGIEFDMAGQFTSGWRMIATYAYCDAKVTKDNTIPVGDHLANIPRQSGSLWNTYRFQDGVLKGFGMGAGLVYVGSREAMLPNTFKLSGYWRTDASLYYTWEKWKAQVNILNVFDIKYFSGGATGTYNQFVRPGQPFSVQAMLSYTF